MQGEDLQALSGIECTCRIFADAMTEGALVLSSEGTISYCNDTFAKMLALSTQQAQGQSLRTFLADPDNELFRQILLQPPHAAPFEVTLRSCDSRAVSTWFSVVDHEYGSQRSAYVIVKEISDSPNSDVSLEDQAKKLAEAIKVLEIFSTMVFHDMRAPLRHIKNFTELLSEHVQGTVDDQGRQYLDIISSAATDINTIINNLLYFYKKIVL